MSTLSHYRPVSFELDGHDDRFLFSDVFIADSDAGRNLIFISTYYPDMEFDFGEVAVTLDRTRLSLFEDNGRDEVEPMRAIIYPIGRLPYQASYNLEVQYRGQRVSMRINNEPPPDERKFALATLFKDDFEQVETCYRYYKQQGVEHFYLFFNGRLSRLSKPLFSAPDITYGEWNYRYWIDAGSKQHHAQSMFLTLMRYRFLPRSSYMALVDLDELMAVRGKNMTLRDYIYQADEESVTAPMYWAEVRNPNNASLRNARQANLRGSTPNISLTDLEHLWANPSHEGEARTKTVYRGDYEGFCGVHRPKRPYDTNARDDLALYHLVNTTHGRYNMMKADAAQVKLTLNAQRGGPPARPSAR